MQRKSRLPEVGKLVLLTTIWIMLPLFAAIPIADISQLGFLDSLFEAVSGLTTAGGSILKTVESWPQGLLFWRIQLQWFGGFLALMTVLLIVAPMRIGGLTSRSSVYLGNLNRDGTQLRAFGSVSKIFIIYTAMTVLCSIILFMSGARAFYSVTLAMTAVSTGGFLPFDDALDTHVSSIGIFTMTLFLLLGATSVFWQRMLVDRSVSRLSSHRESYSVIALIAILSLIYMMIIVAISAPSANAVGKALLEGFFVATSLVATSGIETRPGTIALIPLIVVLFIILLGGSAYSTTGGLKHYRMGAMLVQSWNEIERLIYPHNVKPAKFGTQDYNIDRWPCI
jgi:trk system potassium uptake protein TrkH